MREVSECGECYRDGVLYIVLWAESESTDEWTCDWPDEWADERTDEWTDE